MFSIRSMFVATVALATLASAIPFSPEKPPFGATNAPLRSSGDISKPSTSTTQILPIGAVGDTDNTDIGNLNVGSVNPSVVSGPLLVKRGYGTTPGDILNTCKGGIGPIADDIQDMIAAKTFDRVKVIVLLNQIVVILNTAIADLKTTAAAHLTADLLLTVGGVVGTVAELAAIVYGLLELVIVLLAAVFPLAINVDTTLIALVYSIGPLLIELVTLVLSLVVGLDVAVRGLVDATVTDDIKLLGFTKILVMLGIQV